MKRYGTISLLGLFATLLVVVLQNYYSTAPARLPPNTQIIGPGSATQPAEFLFCHWNVENFFDDKNDGRTGPGDREYDAAYANNPELLRQKLAKLTEAILKMNAGKGPDILAIVEVESVRAVELLQKALNDKLTDPSLHYRNVLMKEISVGRHIAPAILTRLNVIKDRTRTLDKQHRILVGHLLANDQELVVIASHWTSRLKDSNVKGRFDYADKIHGAANAMYRSNPGADFLVSGDFNDDPDDESVRDRLQATGDIAAVRSASSLRLLNLFAGKDPATFGTHYYKQWHVFDQIIASPGMLDNRGWSCDPQSAQVFNSLHKPSDKNKRPWRFGSESEKIERGYSDHFPVLLRLRIENQADAAEPLRKT